MFGLIRLMTRSSGVMAVCLVLLGLALYGIALLSVMLVDAPERGLKVLGVFLLLSGTFCLLLRWTIRRALAQVVRPLEAARQATTRAVARGGHGGREAVRLLGVRTRAAGGYAARALGATLRAARGLGALISPLRGRRAAPPPGRGADVIPLRRGERDRKAR